GGNLVDTNADIQRTITALATYFDNHFQFYGRKLNFEFFNGQGSITNELLGSGQQQADADAVTAAPSERPLPEVPGRGQRDLRRRQPAGQAAQGGDHRPEQPVVPVGRADRRPGGR